MLHCCRLCIRGSACIVVDGRINGVYVSATAIGLFTFCLAIKGEIYYYNGHTRSAVHFLPFFLKRNHLMPWLFYLFDFFSIIFYYWLHRGTAVSRVEAEQRDVYDTQVVNSSNNQL